MTSFRELIHGGTLILAMLAVLPCGGLDGWDYQGNGSEETELVDQALRDGVCSSSRRCQRRVRYDHGALQRDALNTCPGYWQSIQTHQLTIHSVSGHRFANGLLAPLRC